MIHEGGSPITLSMHIQDHTNRIFSRMGNVAATELTNARQPASRTRKKSPTGQCCSIANFEQPP